MKPNEFYGMSLQEVEADERWHRRILVVALIMAFTAGCALGWLAGTSNYSGWPRWLGW
jgi:hypothetical protein